jgi:uncharacterized hydrophobic protein (TIGR00271 family)
MALAVLISSPAEVERFTALGLDLGSRLDEPVAFLCPEPQPADDCKKSDGDRSADRASGKPAAPVDKEPGFPVKTSFLQSTREHVARHIGTLRYGFVQNDVFEISWKIEDIRKWLVNNHESSQLGYFDIDILVIPVLRGAGLEYALAEKELLFETSQVDTILLCVDESCSGRLPLNRIGVTGQNQADLLTASAFARRFANVQVTRRDDTHPDAGQQTVILGIPGKSRQTRIDNNALWKKLRKDESLPVAMVLNPADSPVERFNSAIDDRLRDWFHAYQLSREDRVRLSGKLEAGATSSPEYVLFMSVATILACIGLIQDSPAVIIGAMLVAPLMTPLLGAGLAMIFGNRPLFAKALRTIVVGVLIAYAIGTLVGLFSLFVPDYLFAGGGLSLTSEMIARSQPNLLDPFIGLAAGLAGGFAIGRDGQIGTVAGVAIAAALVPPIATAGLETALAIYAAYLDGNLWTFQELLRQDPAALLQKHGLIGDSSRSTTHVHLVTAPLILFALNACAAIIGAYAGLRMVGMHRTLKPRRSPAWVFAFQLMLLVLICLLMILPLILY